MGSHKRSARQRQVAEFRTQLGNLDDVFERERHHRERVSARRDRAIRAKACTSKNRYPSRVEAKQAIATCAAHGQRGLRCYCCAYCNGWHLTSKPVRN